MRMTYYRGCEDGGKRSGSWMANHQYRPDVERKEARFLFDQLKGWWFYSLGRGEKKKEMNEILERIKGKQ